MLDHIKIMQFADGTLDPNETDEVKKQIDSNPEYQKLLNDYMSTADALAGLGNELRSLELPSELKNKIVSFNQNQKSEVKLNKNIFNFLNIFNFKYSAVAAAFVVVFMGGFYSNQIITQKEQIIIGETVSDTQNIKLRGLNSEFVSSFYNWFNEETFINGINKKIDNVKENEKFSLGLKDMNNNEVYFIKGKIVKDTNSKCREIYYDNKVRLDQSQKSYKISLTVCKDDVDWKLISITLN
jgi:hypothetical protein